MTWPTVPITKVARVVGGATPKTDNPDFWNGRIDWATPKDLSDLGHRYITSTPRKITDAGLRGCAAEVLPAGSVLFSSRAPIGHIAINTVPMATNQGFKSFVPGPELDASFLYWWLDTNRERLQAMGTGATFKEVSKAVVERIEIPLPPLDEQRRIAGILDQADALRRLRSRAFEKLNTLGQAIFHEMFGNLVANERGFEPVVVGDVIDGFETGKNLAGDPDEGRPDGFRVLKISAVTSGIFKSEESKPLPPNYEPPEAHIVRDGDLLFSRANTAQLIGATAFARTNSARLVLPDKLWRFVWKQKSKVRPEFVKALFSSPSFRYEIGKRSSGTSGSMKNIGQQKVMTIPFGLPRIDLQQEFAKRLSVATGQAEANQKLLETYENLFASLQHRAFKGEL